MRGRRHTPFVVSRLLPALFLAGAGLLLAVGAVSARGDEEAKPKPKAKTEAKATKGPHLDYRRTYEQALLEARIRNLPVFVSRHKDF